MKSHMVIICLFSVLLATALCVVSAGAQDITPGDAKTPESASKKSIDSLLEDVVIYPLKPPNTSSPRATLKSFLDNVNDAYRLLMAAHQENMKTPGLFTSESVRQLGKKAEQLFERGVWCLNLSEVPDALKLNVGYEGTLKLKEILDRIELPPFDTLPDAEAVEFEIENKKVPDLVRWPLLWTDIVIAMVEEGTRKGHFLFSPETVARLDEFYNEVLHLPYRQDALVSPGFLEFYDKNPGRLLPPKWSKWLPAWSITMYHAQTLWQWSALLVLPIVAFLFIWGLYRWWRRKAATISPVKRSWGFVFVTVIATATVSLVLHVLVEQLSITGPLVLSLNTALRAIIWLFSAYAAILVGNAVGNTINSSPRMDSEGIHASLITASGALIGFVAAAIIIFHGLSGLGVSLIPLLTGLGVGGFAVALAARPTLENLIGSFMILVDKPYRVGQRVRVKGYEGDVEKIGFRSTRIRLLSGFQSIIPNEEMARLDIENIGRRPYILRKSNITITYDTPPEKVEKAVKIIEDILENHEGMDPKFPPKVFFNEFNSDSLNIVMRYWYHLPDLWTFRAFNHNVNLQIMRAFEKEGIKFAFPTTTNYLTQEDGQPLHINIAGDLQHTG